VFASYAELRHLRVAQNLIRRGLIAVLQMPPGGAQQQQLQQLAPVAPLSADNRKRRR
jgi:hypothetical protein